MRTRLRWTAAALLLGATLLTGCGNKEKAAMFITLDANSRYPAMQQALERVDLAGTIALMALDSTMAKELRSFAETHGKEVRETVEKKFNEGGQEAGKLVGCADGLIQAKAATTHDQAEYVAKALGDRKDMLTSSADTLQLDELVKAHTKALEPVVDQLSDRQQLVVLGHWKSASEAVTQLVKMAKNTDKVVVDAKREEILTSLVQARGYGGSSEEPTRVKAAKVVARIAIGQADTSGVEAAVAGVFEALPAKDAAKQRSEALQTLATMLCQSAAAELLALVP